MTAFAEALYICVRLPDGGEAAAGRVASARAVLSGVSDAVDVLSPTQVLAQLNAGPGAIRHAAAVARYALVELARSQLSGCSGGVGPNRALAALAADLADAGSVLALTRADVPTVLWPLPVERLPGVGPSVAALLRRAGMATVGEVALAGPGALRARFGPRGHALWAAAHGRDPAAATVRAAGVAGRAHNRRGA